MRGESRSRTLLVHVAVIGLQANLPSFRIRQQAFCQQMVFTVPFSS
jgi:hypothetical protein